MASTGVGGICAGFRRPRYRGVAPFPGRGGGGGSLSDSVQKRTDAGFAHLVHFDCAPRVRNVLQDPLGEIRKRNSGAFRFELVCAKLRARAIREHVLDPLDRALTILHQFRSIAAEDGVCQDLSELCRYPDSQFYGQMESQRPLTAFSGSSRLSSSLLCVRIW